MCGKCADNVQYQSKTKSSRLFCNSRTLRISRQTRSYKSGDRRRHNCHLFVSRWHVHATNRAPGSNIYTRSQRARDGPLSGSCSSCGCASRAASSSPTAPKAHTSYSSHNKTSTKSLSLSSFNVDELRPRTLYFTEEPFFLCFPLRVDHLGPY